MNTDRELMQQALEALELHAEQYPHMQKGYTVDAITVLRERLAQPVQEPYGYFQLDLRLDAWVQNRDSNKGVAFYTTPPQRKPLPPQSPCEMTQAESKMFRLGWLECEAAHGIKGS